MHDQYLPFLPNMIGIFVSGMYLAITCELEVAVGCALVNLCKNTGSIYLFSMLLMRVICAMWQSCLFCGVSVKNVYSAPLLNG